MVKPEVSIESAPEPGAGRTRLLLRGHDPIWIRELFHAIRALRFGPDTSIAVHELPGFAGSDKVELYLHVAVSDLGVSGSSATRVFHWHRTEQGWARVEELLAPFCSRDVPVVPNQILDALGEVDVVFSSGPAAGSGVADLTAWLGRDRRCYRHPLQKAVTLCRRCTSGLCDSCAELQPDGRSRCSGGCEDKSYVQYLPDADAEYGSLLLIGTQIRTARELFHGIRSLRRGRRDILAVHELPGFVGRPHAELYLHSAGHDDGVHKRVERATFDWYLTSVGWEQVEDTLAQGCDRFYSGEGTFNLQEKGDFCVMLGWDW